MGELHLEVLVDRMLREFSVDATVGKPQVAYRETITKPVEKDRYRHKKQTGGSGQFADVDHRPRAHRPRRWLRVRRQDHRWPDPEGVHPVGRPGHPGVAHLGRARRLPDRRRPRSRCSTARYHDVDSSEMAFKIAGSMGFKEAARKAKPVLLEPIMSVEVVTPEDYMGDVIGDLNSPPGPGRGHGAAGQRPSHPGPRAAVGDVRLRRTTSGRAPRAGPPTRCSSTPTSRCR